MSQGQRATAYSYAYTLREFIYVIERNLGRVRLWFSNLFVNNLIIDFARHPISSSAVTDTSGLPTDISHTSVIAIATAPLISE